MRTRFTPMISGLLKKFMSRQFLLHLGSHLLHERWITRLVGLLLLSLILSYLLGLLLRRNQLGAILWRGLVLSLALLGIFEYLPSIIAFPSYKTMSANFEDEPQVQSAPNDADPLDLSYRPKIDTNPQDYPSNVWVTDSMQKVHQDIGKPGSVHGQFFQRPKTNLVIFKCMCRQGAARFHWA